MILNPWVLRREGNHLSAGVKTNHSIAKAEQRVAGMSNATTHVQGFQEAQRFKRLSDDRLMQGWSIGRIVLGGYGSVTVQRFKSFKKVSDTYWFVDKL